MQQTETLFHFTISHCLDKGYTHIITMSHIDNNHNTANHVQLSPIYNYMQQQEQQHHPLRHQQNNTINLTADSNHAHTTNDIPASRSHVLENNHNHNSNNSNNSNNHTTDNHNGSKSQVHHEVNMPQKLPLPLLPQKPSVLLTQTMSPPFDASSPPQHEKVESLSTTQKKFLLSTSSPEGIQVASKITPTRLANLLIRKGPLPIRHITAQLTIEVPSFELLSLSKQRRLIMAAMEQVDSTNNVVFEKIGWGQWAVRKVDSDYIVTEGTEQQEQKQQQQAQQQSQQQSHEQHLGGTPQSVLPEGRDGSSGKKPGKQITSLSIELEKKMININDLRNQTNLKLGWSKKKKDGGGTIEKNGTRRESITNPVKNLHNIRLPNESIDNAIASDSEDDDEEEDRFNELEEDEVDFDEDDEDDDDDISGLDERLIRNGRRTLHEHIDEDEPSNSSDQDAILDEDEDEEMFAFDETPINRTTAIRHKLKAKKLSPPLKFANRVPSKISPPPISSAASSYDSKAAARRRKSSSSAPSSVTKPSTLRHYHATTHHPHHTHLLNNPTFINRSRLNSIENLDNYIASTSSGRNSTVSISLPPPAIAFSYSSAGLGGGVGSGDAIDVRSAVFGASPVSASNASPVGSWGSSTGNRHYVIHNEEAAKANKGRRKSSFNESHERSTLNSIRQQLQLLLQQSKTLPQLSTTLQQQQSHQRSSSISSDTDEEDWQSIGPEFLRQKRPNSEALPSEERKPVELGLVDVNGANSKGRDPIANASDADANEEEKSAAFALVNLMSV